uniref:Uncharacterized protein n=1 Tax=Opuntia streptacantha TaxID=393608 RepID=A0A7C9ENV0_OPUST
MQSEILTKSSESRWIIVLKGNHLPFRVKSPDWRVVLNTYLLVIFSVVRSINVSFLCVWELDDLFHCIFMPLFCWIIDLVVEHFHLQHDPVLTNQLDGLSMRWDSLVTATFF